VQYLRRLDLGRLVLLAIVVVATVGAFTKDSWDWMFGANEAQTQGVDAPVIEDVDQTTERLYRIVPGNGSEVRYVVNERLAGEEAVAVGRTSTVGGDIVIDDADPAASRVGEVVVNVEMFESDSALRDKRLRHDYLESSHWPFASFVTNSISGIPAEIDPASSYPIVLDGMLTVKETTLPVQFAGDITVTDSAVEAHVSAQIRGSWFDVGPINIARLAHTDDELTLEFDLVADRVSLDDAGQSTGDLDSQLLVPEVATGAFAQNVLPILENRCVSCHSANGPGWSTLALDTVGDAAAIANDIALVTGAGYMPPWSPSESSPAFHNDWSLDQTELDALATWAGDGGGIDVAPDTALVARNQLVNPIERDQEIHASAAYVGSVDQPDDYRCQVYEVDDPEGDGTWVKGFAFEPDKSEVVHHSIVYRAPKQAWAEVEALDGSDGKPGWTCFGGANMATPGVYSVLGWAPGMQPTLYPQGVGTFLEPGDFLINQIHYHFDHETPADNSGIVLDVAESDEISAGMRSIESSTYLTPAEMPCTAEEAVDAPLCDRDAVLRDLASKYGRGVAGIPGALIGQCGGTVDDYDDLVGTVAHSSCDLAARDYGTVFSVLGHMHEFGAAYRMTLNPDTPQERVLLDIPTWSFEWQLAYQPVEEIRIERGDVVRFECTWDRSLMYMPEPRYVTWAYGTVDEMCFSSIRVVPDK